MGAQPHGTSLWRFLYALYHEPQFPVKADHRSWTRGTRYLHCSFRVSINLEAAPPADQAVQTPATQGQGI